MPYHYNLRHLTTKLSYRSTLNLPEHAARTSTTSLSFLSFQPSRLQVLQLVQLPQPHYPLRRLSSSSSSSSPALRIVSYNILSPELATPDRFPTCHSTNELSLDPSIRLGKILQKIKNEITNNNNNNTTTNAKTRHVIFCLQEVSRTWVGNLHVFFSRFDYSLITSSYGSRRDGYMGVAVAYPSKTLELMDADVSRVSDYFDIEGWSSSSTTKTTTSGGLMWIRRMWATLRQWTASVSSLVPAPLDEDDDQWYRSKRRRNTMIHLRLRPRPSATLVKDMTTKNDNNEASSPSIDSSFQFCIATYHMPCAFRHPMVMNIHAAMATRRAQMLSKEDALILAGDFNFLPESEMYELVTTGGGDEGMVKYGLRGDDGDAVSLEAMRSAYAEANGGEEADFTNYAQVEDQEPFIGTLDYIFISDHWTVTGAKALVNRSNAEGPYPNDKEPSDHVLIAADLDYNNK